MDDETKVDELVFVLSSMFVHFRQFFCEPRLTINVLDLGLWTLDPGQPMELDLTRITWPVVVAALLVVAIGFGLLGAAVTPVDAQGEPMLLTAGRWTAARLARQAKAETEALVKDAAELRRLLEREHPDPIDAMLLAQRLYAEHRTGSTATVAARQALIAAAEVIARYAVGAAARQEAIDAYHAAMASIEALSPESPATPTPSRQYLPHIQSP